MKPDDQWVQAAWHYWGRLSRDWGLNPIMPAEWESRRSPRKSALHPAPVNQQLILGRMKITWGSEQKDSSQG